MLLVLCAAPWAQLCGVTVGNDVDVMAHPNKTTLIACFMNHSLGVPTRVLDGGSSFGASTLSYTDYLFRSVSRTMRFQPLPVFKRWHVTSQDRLFRLLVAAGWDAAQPRVMVELGCHAGHGRHKNMSDALLWLQHFHAPCGLVLGVDAFEDFSQDLQYRFDHVEPYRSIMAVEKRTLT